jgi:hypothetical protein
MRPTPKMGWWIAAPLGLVLGLGLAVALDRSAAPATAQGAAAAGFTVSVEQLRINQRIAQTGVKRANRANDRLDTLGVGASGAQAPAGPAGPAGVPGPAGPAGPGAARIAYSAAEGSPPQTVLELAGITLSLACETGGSGETSLVIRADTSAPTTVIGTSITDGGTDPNSPDPAEASNFAVDLPAGPGNVLGGDSAPDGEFRRSVVNPLFVTPTQTISVHLALIADGTADRCSFNGVAVLA